MTLLGVFLPHLESQFEVEGHPELTLELVSGKPIQDSFAKTEPDPPEAKCYSLTFKGPAGVRLSQGLYPLNHPVLGPKHIFLVPVGCSEDRYQMEAIFNQMERN